MKKPGEILQTLEVLLQRHFSDSEEVNIKNADDQQNLWGGDAGS